MAEPEEAQGFCKQEAPGPACFGSEKDRGRLLGGDWAQGKKWASLATGTGNRGGGAQEAGLSSYTCRHWTKPWGCSSDGNTEIPVLWHLTSQSVGKRIAEKSRWKGLA